MTFKDPPDKQRPTLKTIASLTGLGVSTVSRALKDGPEISENTKCRVREVAKDIGYHPNRAGVRLRTGKTNIISLVLDTHESTMGLVSGMVYGISDVLAGTQYHLVVTPYSLNDPMEPIRYIAETRSADGIILSRIQPRDPRVVYLLEKGIPFATHGRTDMDVIHPFHDFDNEAFAREAVKQLARRNRKKIGLLGPPSDYSFYRHTRAGFDAQRNIQNLEEITLGNLNIDSPAAAIRALGQDIATWTNRPDGIISSAFVSTVALCWGIEEAGLKIGRDIDIVTKRSSEISSLMKPEVIGIEEDFRQAGHDLAQAVIAWINGSDPAGYQFIVGPKIS